MEFDDEMTRGFSPRRYIIRNVSAAPLNLQPVFSGTTWKSDKRSRPILGLTIESVRDPNRIPTVTSAPRGYKGNPKIYKASMTSPCLA